MCKVKKRSYFCVGHVVRGDYGYFGLCPWNYGGDDFRGGGFLEKLKIEMPPGKNPVQAPASG